MVIKKSDAVQVQETEKLYLKKVEATIDAKLASRFAGPGSNVLVYFQEIRREAGWVPNLEERMRKKLIERYEDAGWTVRYQYDAHEGAWFDFS
ncbi:MAG: hypothetical protein ABIB98_01650 [bacterium]